MAYKKDTVTNPSTSTDNALPRFDGTTGKLIQGSSVIVNDSNEIEASGISFDSGTNTLGSYLASVSWTPVIKGSTAAGTGTYTGQVGKYTRIGNIVWLSFALTWTAHTGTGNMRMASLPVTPDNTAGLRPVGSVQSASITYPAGITYIYPVIAGDASSTDIFIQGSGDNVGATDILMDTAGSIVGSIVYTAG